jgi:hypothetical protein
MMRSHIGSWTVSLLFFAGCAHYPDITQQLTTAENSARAAQDEGALQQPQAALHLRLAQEQIIKARELIQSGESERADYTLMRADSDAELALMIVKAAKAQAEAKNAKSQYSPLRPY